MFQIAEERDPSLHYLQYKIVHAHKEARVLNLKYITCMNKIGLG